MVCLSGQMKRYHVSDFLKCRRVSDLCNHMVHWDTVNKKSNVSNISYYIDIDKLTKHTKMLHFNFSIHFILVWEMAILES